MVHCQRRIWQCREQHARRQFSAKVGSVMEASPLGIDKWLIALWLIGSAKNGISSYELHRAVGITQKSAWFMLHRIRLAMQDQSGGKLGGHVEIDETYIGGKARNMHAGRKARIITGTGGMGKVAVMGLLARHVKDGHSTVRVSVVQNNRKVVLQGNVRENVKRARTSTATNCCRTTGWMPITFTASSTMLNVTWTGRFIPMAARTFGAW
jgi:hypothetical protein